jgi:tyrosyl-tRNA synthetase
MSFWDELKWRGLIHDATEGVEAVLKTPPVSGYLGFDPSAPSLHIGNLVQIMLLVHFQRSGNKPIALVGGATGMIGDPSGKSEERKLLSEEIIRDYEVKIKDQLSKFLDFNSKVNPAIMSNNYDWYKSINILDFLREAGKHLTVNYMMAKDSVKNRLETGISFTEFSYQLLQGYDYYQLNQKYGCALQMGGSDQWGNITSGIELIRRISGNEVYAITTPLITRADGKKFGKTEEGNVWLDAAMTSPYKFYQFWLNTADEDAVKYIRIFTLLREEDIKALEVRHAQAPHLRELQKELAKDITKRVHSVDDYNFAMKASEILFGNSAIETLKTLSNVQFEMVFEGVPRITINKSELEGGMNVLELVADKTKFFPSRGEVKRTIQGKGLSINSRLVETTELTVTTEQLLNNRYLLLQKGKKNYFLVVAE